MFAVEERSRCIYLRRWWSHRCHRQHLVSQRPAREELPHIQAPSDLATCSRTAGKRTNNIDAIY